MSWGPREMLGVSEFFLCGRAVVARSGDLGGRGSMNWGHRERATGVPRLEWLVQSGRVGRPGPVEGCQHPGSLFCLPAEPQACSRRYEPTASLSPCRLHQEMLSQAVPIRASGWALSHPSCCPHFTEEETEAREPGGQREGQPQELGPHFQVLWTPFLCHCPEGRGKAGITRALELSAGVSNLGCIVNKRCWAHFALLCVWVCVS